MLLENARLRAEVETLSAEVKTLSSENEAQSARIETLSSENATLQAKTRHMAQRIAYLVRMLYGARSDRLAKQAAGQPSLFEGIFNEAMDERDKAIADTAKEIKKEGEARRARARKRPRRPSRYQYAGLEERTTVLMPEGVNPDEYDIIGKDVTRVLHRQAPKLWVEVIERPIMRLKADKEQPSPRIEQAAAPEAVIGGNHVAADLLAQLVIDKYTYHLPEYRQAKMYADLGVKLPTSTINDWIHAVAQKLYPLYESLGEQIRESGYLQVDEVPWRVADSPGKTRKGYAWQFLDANPDPKGLYFYYLKGSRAGEIPRAQLKNYRGAIQTDGYTVYDYFELQDGVTLLGCMAHVRRKFTDAQTSHPAEAAKAVEYISLLYTLEENLRSRGASFEEIARERQAKAIPIMDAMEEWMKGASLKCGPSDPLGKALDYAYKLWPRLRRYALDGRYQIDNNAVERGQRPSVMGRKNYLFSKNDRGAEDNAVFYSLLESCDIVGVKPLKWLTHALEHLRADSTEDEITALLPYNYKKSQE